MLVKYLLIAVCLLSVCSGKGQNLACSGPNADFTVFEPDIDHNFCNTLMGAVFNVFYNVDSRKGQKIETTALGPRYSSKIEVMGVRNSTVVGDSVWWYEGVIYHDYVKKEFEGYYSEYSSQLRHCLDHGGSGYVYSTIENKNKKLEAYPDSYYRYKTGGVVIELRSERSETDSIYTLTVFVKKG